MGFALVSLSSCFAVVPDAIRLWKPEHAPQATVMNSAGNSVLPLASFQLVNGGTWNSALPVAAEKMMPKIATIIIA